MIPPNLPYKKYFLKPCEAGFIDKPSIFTTILGSCVGVTMFHLPTKIAAISHSLLPYGPGPSYCQPGCNTGFKYVDSSIKFMFEFFCKQNINIKEISVKVFGGGDVTLPEEVIDRFDNLSVGRQNVEAAFGTLQEYGIYPVHNDVRGSNGRKIIFYTHNGDVFVKRVERVC
ncbi:MAG: chemotaxis protein CheD [Candidatus Riflebacteria bacterium]|nr:chemotaxis protein CheD [Candidatus Riflebacteria bacterium]